MDSIDHLDLADLDAVEPWRADAACREADDPTVFFPGRGDTSAVRAAKATCERCLVQEECLEFALRRGIKDGIFGGLSAKQRREIRSKEAASA